MKRPRARHTAPVVLACLALAVLAVASAPPAASSPAPATPRAAAGDDDLSPTLLAGLEKPAAKLDSAIWGALQAWRDGGRRGLRRHADDHDLDVRGSRLLVRVDAGLPAVGLPLSAAGDADLVDRVREELLQRGARIRRVFGSHIEAYVPLAELEAIRQNVAIRGLRRPWTATPHRVISEGVEVIGADRWEGVTFRVPEDGVRVGVVDVGFEGFRDLLGEDLPAMGRVTTRSFLDDEDIENDTVHGSAVAEIVFDVVPDVRLFLANIDTAGDLAEAIDWMIDQGVQVINMSLGFFGAGPGNGTGPVVDIVERAPNAGVTFVTSAGNQADRHWLGPFRDADGDGILEYTAGGDETNSFHALAGDEIDIFLTWDFDDWTSSEQDLDLVLLDDAGRIVDASSTAQNGNAGDFAVEAIRILAPRTADYSIVVRRFDADPDQPVELHTFFSGLEHVVAAGSLSVPADSRLVVAAGATRVSNDRVEFFSSRGPTHDGRIKPDLAAPDRVSTVSFGTGAFAGTSAAAPHTTGAIALFIGRLGLVTGDEAFEMLIPRALDLGPPGKDNASGHGRLSVLPPR